MSEENGEKRFEATPSRRDRAKREGNVARSHELAAIASFGGALLASTAALPMLAAASVHAVRDAARLAPALSLISAALIAGTALLPAACAAVAGAGMTLAQGGGLRLTPLKLNLGKLAPLPGLKRMFGAEAGVAAARAGLAFLTVIAVVTPMSVRTAATAMGASSPAVAAGTAVAGMLQACFAAAAAGALFAFADYALVRRRWLHSLKMTFDDVKRDAKEQDGDPQAKSRRKQLHRSLVRGGVARLREASFVVVNPTHLAIALRYAPPGVPVPEILVRAADAAALDVRAAAERLRVPVVEDVVLARLLWRCGESGRPIPAESFVAVAIVIAALMRSGALAP